MKQLLEVYADIMGIFESASEEEKIGLRLAIEAMNKKIVVKGERVVIIGNLDHGKTTDMQPMKEFKLELIPIEPLEFIEVKKESSKQFYKDIAK